MAILFLIFQVAIVAFGLFSGGATGRSSIGSLTEGADMSLSQVRKDGDGNGDRNGDYDEGGEVGELT